MSHDHRLTINGKCSACFDATCKGCPFPRLRTYRVTYRDTPALPGEPTFTMTMRGYDKEHVDIKFYNSVDADGWEIVSIVEIKGDKS